MTSTLKPKADEERHHILEIVTKQGTQIAELDTRSKAMENVVSNMNVKMDQIVSVLAEIKAAPKWSYGSILTNVKDTAVLLGLTVAGLVYVINATNGLNDALLTERQTANKTALTAEINELRTDVDRIQQSHWTKQDHHHFCLINKRFYPDMFCDAGDTE